VVVVFVVGEELGWWRRLSCSWSRRCCGGMAEGATNRERRGGDVG